MRHAIRHRFAFVRIIVAMLAMSGGMAYAQANSNSLPNPYLTIDAGRRCPRKDVGANVPIEFGS